MFTSRKYLEMFTAFYLDRMAKFVIEVCLTTLIHNLIQGLSVPYGIHQICFLCQFQCLTTSCLLSNVSWQVLLLLNVRWLCLVSTQSSQCYCVEAHYVLLIWKKTHLLSQWGWRIRAYTGPTLFWLKKRYGNVDQDCLLEWMLLKEDISDHQIWSVHS